MWGGRGPGSEINRKELVASRAEKRERWSGGDACRGELATLWLSLVRRMQGCFGVGCCLACLHEALLVSKRERRGKFDLLGAAKRGIARSSITFASTHTLSSGFLSNTHTAWLPSPEHGVSSRSQRAKPSHDREPRHRHAPAHSPQP